MIDDATAIRCFLRYWSTQNGIEAEPTDGDVAFWAEALEPLGDDIQGGLMRAVRACKHQPSVREILRISGAVDPGSTMRVVAEGVAEMYGLSMDDIAGPETKRSVSIARQHVMFELVRAGFSTSEVGRLVNRDHTTVTHGNKAHKERMAKEMVDAKRLLQ